MNELNWISELQSEDTSKPEVDVKEEPAYTLYVADFLQMPSVNYMELSSFDPLIRALLN